MDELKYAKRPNRGRAGRRKKVETKINMLNILTHGLPGVPRFSVFVSSSSGDDFRTAGGVA